MFTGLRRHNRLPPEALAQFKTALNMYDRLRDGLAGPFSGADDAVKKLRERAEKTPESLWWSDFEEAELCIITILSEQELRARVLSWRSHFHDVVGDAQYALYLAGAPPIATMTLDQVRADVTECIRQTYYYYGAYGVAAHSRSSVTKALLLVASVVLGVQALIALIFTWTGTPWSSQIGLSDDSRRVIQCLLATSAAAVLGSVVSVQRRLQDPTVNVDPFYRYVQTTTDWFGIAFVSPIFGALFGLLIYGLIEAQLIGSTLISFDNHGYPKPGKDLATMLVFGFVAGFAEQLIPDTLTRLAARALGSVVANAPPPPPLAKANGALQDGAQSGTPKNGAPTADVTVEPAKLKTVPGDITDEARTMGHDASLASESSADDLKKGLLT